LKTDTKLFLIISIGGYKLPQFKILLYTAQLANDKIVTYAAKSFS